MPVALAHSHEELDKRGGSLERVSSARSIAALRQLAMRRLPSSVFHFFDGGAEDEVTLVDNQAAFGRRRLRPKVPVDVDRVDLTCTLLGAPAGSPLVVAPMGGINTARPGADVMIAKAAAQAGIPYTLSTTATTSIEDVARSVQGRLWFQLYVLRDEQQTERLIERAQVCCYEALVLAVDVPVAGKRERDSLELPMRWTAKTLLDFCKHPRWLARMAPRGGLPSETSMLGMTDERVYRSHSSSPKP